MVVLSATLVFLPILIAMAICIPTTALAIQLSPMVMVVMAAAGAKPVIKSAILHSAMVPALTAALMMALQPELVLAPSITALIVTAIITTTSAIALAVTKPTNLPT